MGRRSGATGAARLHCPLCLRPQRTCICQWIAPIAHGVEVLVLQHPLEVDNAKGSARLLHLSLPHSRMVTGEVFAEPQLQALLTAPLHPDTQESHPKHVVLLYPDMPHDQAQGVAVPPPLPPEYLLEPAQLRLVVLDGTWRKSRKMLYCNPLLQQLPRLSLRDLPASHYLIRKAHRPDQLSTLEATCAAMAQLERSVEKFQPLLAAFDGFVAQQMGYRTGQHPP
ncbi:MAG: tRNA-uridine aminocarboxypropyltransferase [Rhodoferax sp.]|nr:tRNA-uridine aminocarboxypropyltransferase [Rhodoferax sp.]